MGLEDLEDIVEVIFVDMHNKRVAAEIRRKQDKEP